MTEMTNKQHTIRTFSGVHAWDPTVVLDSDAHEQGTADDIIKNIEAGRCPRCERPLPEPPEYPAGSRITECRSIPICGQCGSDELLQAIGVLQAIGWGISPAGYWPLPVAEIEERCAQFESNATIAIISGDKVITEDGVATIVSPRNTGGWAQYGFQREPRPDGD